MSTRLNGANNGPKIGAEKGPVLSSGQQGLREAYPQRSCFLPHLELKADFPHYLDISAGHCPRFWQWESAWHRFASLHRMPIQPDTLD